MRITAKFRQLIRPCIFLALVLPAGAQQAASPPPQKVGQQLTISVVPGQMKYDTESFTAKPGSSIRITLVNKDAMQHNLVICKSGTGVGLKVAQAAWALGAEALTRQYIPDSPDVLFHSRLVEPNGQDAFVFKAPAAEGDYPYVCTMPGHAMTMNGVMHIRRRGGPAQHGVLGNLSFQIFPRAGSLAAVSQVTPAAPVKQAGAAFSLEPTKQLSRPFAIAFQGTLSVTANGKYNFELGSSAADLSVDGKTILTVQGSVQDADLDLQKGPHAVLLRYVCREEEPWCDVSFRAPHSLLTEALMQALPKQTVLDPGTAPLVQRVNLPGTSPESVAVGLPGGVNYCFDPERCAVSYGWTGRFLDMGPNLMQRGGKQCEILGKRFEVGSGGCPLRIGTNDNPVVKFLGYRVGATPQMLFSVDGQKVVQTVAPAISPEAVHGFSYRFELPGVGEPVRLVFPAGPVRFGGPGAVQDGVLKVPAEQAADFTVTVFPAK